MHSINRNSTVHGGRIKLRIRRQKVDNQPEKQILTGMIISDRVLREIQSIYKPELIEIPFVKIVAKWCLDYFKQYEKAPQQHIQDIYNSWARKNEDEDRVELIGEFLSSISQEYERADKFNDQYILDQAERRFKSKSLRSLAEDIKAELSADNIMEAEALLNHYKRVERPSSNSINPFTNADAIFDAFESDQEPLFTFPGTFGRLVNDQFVRDGFVGVMGPEKRGKSWWLQEFAIRAAKARCNVAFFAVGDMSKSQMIIRKHIRLAGKSNKKIYCGKVRVPFLHREQNEEGKEENVVKHKAIRITKPLTWREGLRYGKQFMKRLKGRDYKLSVYPNKSINVQGIKAQLDIWEHFESFVPDVIVIDYADILAPEDPKKEYRHQQNETWQALRALSQEKHCLVITATQADAASYDVNTLKLKNFSEDKRKYGHVTGMLSLNQTEEEKREGVMRIGWLLLREGDFNSSSTVRVLQCLKIGKPYIDSCW